MSLYRDCTFGISNKLCKLGKTKILSERNEARTLEGYVLLFGHVRIQHTYIEAFSHTSHRLYILNF